jgi:hypothetical protein
MENRLNKRDFINTCGVLLFTFIFLMLLTACNGQSDSNTSNGASDSSPVATITAPSSVTGGQAGCAASVQAQTGCTYSWSATNGTITADVSTRSITFTAGSTGTATLTCTVTNSSGKSTTGSASCGIKPANGASMNTEQTISDQAQSMTIAFDGLAFVTGSFCAQTFYPPGKVADFFCFQYLRDNDPSGMGHNTDFTTLTADPILVLLNDTQLKILSDLGAEEAALNDKYGYSRLPLAEAFRRLCDGDLPDGKTGLSRDAVKAYSAYLFSIDGEMSYLRAQAYASVLGSMDSAQQATLASMKGKGSLEWTQPTQAQVDAVLKKYPGQMMRTYAGEMLAW